MDNRNVKKFAFAMGLFLIAFLAVIVIAEIVGKDSGYSETENRSLQMRPALTKEALQNGTFESQYETYVNDQFPLRNIFVKIKMQADYLLGKRESQDVYLGTDGSLLEQFTPPQKENRAQTLAAIANLAAAYPTLNQYFLLAPNAISIYQDKLPTGAPYIDQSSYIEDFENDLLGSTPVKVIDIRNEFLMEKEKGLYYKTDHHWTQEAAYIAFLKACAVMGFDANTVAYEKVLATDSFQGSLTYKSGLRLGAKEDLFVYLPTNGVHSAISYVEEQTKTATFFNHKKLSTTNGYEVFLDGNHSQVLIENAVDSDRVLLVFKDSYANCFIPFLAPYYNEIVVIDPRYYYDDINELIAAEGVTDVLYLYNANTFFADTTLKTILS